MLLFTLFIVIMPLAYFVVFLQFKCDKMDPPELG
jgi:hypothetical protein